MNVVQKTANKFQLLTVKYENLTARLERLKKQSIVGSPIRNKTPISQNHIKVYQNICGQVSSHSLKRLTKDKTKFGFEDFGKCNNASQKHIANFDKQNFGIAKGYTIRRSQAAQTMTNANINIYQIRRQKNIKKTQVAFSSKQIEKPLLRKGNAKQKRKEFTDYPMIKKLDEDIQSSMHKFQISGNSKMKHNDQKNENRIYFDDKSQEKQISLRANQFRNSTEMRNSDQKNKITEKQDRSFDSQNVIIQKCYNKMSRQSKNEQIASKYGQNSRSKATVTQNEKPKRILKRNISNLQQSFNRNAVVQCQYLKKDKERIFIPGKIYRSNQM